MKNKWSDQDKQSFKDGNVLKAKAVPGKRDPGPSASEWLVPPGEEEYFQRLIDRGVIEEAERLFDLEDAGVDMGPGVAVDEVLAKVQAMLNEVVLLERTDVAQQDFDRRTR